MQRNRLWRCPFGAIGFVGAMQRNRLWRCPKGAIGFAATMQRNRQHRLAIKVYTRVI
jgi:hypothetical protein